jgi:hypothetical protein
MPAPVSNTARFAFPAHHLQHEVQPRNRQRVPKKAQLHMLQGNGSVGVTFLALQTLPRGVPASSEEPKV